MVASAAKLPNLMILSSGLCGPESSGREPESSVHIESVTFCPIGWTEELISLFGRNGHCISLAFENIPKDTVLKTRSERCWIHAKIDDRTIANAESICTPIKKEVIDNIPLKTVTWHFRAPPPFDICRVVEKPFGSHLAQPYDFTLREFDPDVMKLRKIG